MLYINRQFAEAIPSLLLSAKRSIKMTVYCMSPLTSTTTPRQRAVITALLDARKRGIICQAIIAKMNASTPGGKANQMSYDMLRTAGWQVRMSRAAPILHAKIIICDEHSATIGSHNLTDSALFSNHEATILVTDRDQVQRLGNMFNAIWTANNPQAPEVLP